MFHKYINVTMLKYPAVRNVLPAIGIAFLGFILLNLTFMLDYLFHISIIGLVKLFTSQDPGMRSVWFPPAMHIAFTVLIGLISWIIFRSRLNNFFKATFLTVPSAVVLVTAGMFLYRLPIIAYSLSSLLVAGILFIFYRTKMSWLFSFAVILVALTLLISNLLGMEM
jgi:hypothetical protein